MDRQKHIHVYVYTIIMALIVINECLGTTKFDVFYMLKKTKMPLWKKGPFNISRLFDMVLKSYKQYTNRYPIKSVIQCSNFTSEVALTDGSHAFNATLDFHNVTFHGLSSVDYIHNMSEHKVFKNIAVSETVLACRDMFVMFHHQRPFRRYFRSDIAICSILKPYVRVTLKYYARQRKVTVIRAVFGRMNDVHHYIPMRSRYEHYKNRLGDLLYDQFLHAERTKLDLSLADMFRIAVDKSGIIDGLDVTIMPGM